MAAPQERVPVMRPEDHTLIRWMTEEVPSMCEISKVKRLLRRYNVWLVEGSDFVEVIDVLVDALHFWYDGLRAY